MTILWCGGEDIDFSQSGVIPGISNVDFDNTLSRCSVGTTDSLSYLTNIFSETPITSAWISGVSSVLSTGSPYIGLVNNTGSGIFLRKNSGSTLYSLCKYNGSTWNDIASSTLSSATGLVKFDMQIIDYGVSSTIRCYANKILLIDWTGDCTIAGISGFTRISIRGNFTAGNGRWSQLIVSDSDTRNMTLCTSYPNAFGDINNFSGSYVNIDEITNSDTDLVTSSEIDAIFQTRVSNLPSAAYRVLGCRLAYRASRNSSNLQLQHGIKVNGTENLETLLSFDILPTTHDKIYQINPVTSLPFTPYDIDTLQLEFKTIAG